MSTNSTKPLSRYARLMLGLITPIALSWGSTFSAAAYATDHVLIMTISNYVTQPLAGVKFDAANAMRIASRLGYDTSAAMVFKDTQLTAKGLKEALGQLALRVQNNDRVFVYYSGHGYSHQQANLCVQTLVGQDGGLVSLSELSAQLDKIKTLTKNVFVLIDACHSGGLGEMAVTRGIPGEEVVALLSPEAGVSAKVFQPRNGEACQNPVNFTKAWDVPSDSGARGTAFPQDNFTFIAAANEREVALDDSERGGLATTSLLRCLDSGVTDKDGSGAISAKELIACAQENIVDEVPKINARKKTRWSAHTLEGYGNVTRALNNVKIIATAASQSIPAPDNSSSVTQSNTTVIAARTISAFEQFAAGSNGNWAVNVEMPSSVKMGDKSSLYYSSVQPGYMTIIYMGSDGKDIEAIANNVPIEATSRKLLGHIPITDCPGGCPGNNTFLVIFSQVKLNTALLLRYAKSGQKIPLTNEILGDLQCAGEIARDRNASTLELVPNCKNLTRNAGQLEVAKGANIEGYAARVLVVRGY